MKYSLLDTINSPDDLKMLSDDKIPQLITEIREFLVDTVERTGGHLASNLGVIELTLAIHKVFDSPNDHVIFDVGHQAYVHKLVTGRRERFSDLRTPGGLSGFTSRRESPHDPFGAGHSSTSVSAALGFAEADQLLDKERYTVCVIGDGAYTGGMVHEALNNSRPDLPLIIILNENGMSISLNKGAFASYLSRVRVSRRYRKLKRGTNNVLAHIPFVGRPLIKLAVFTKKKIKSLIYKPNYFEELGLYYIGPIDGNDYEKVRAALSKAKSLRQTVVVHIKTTKGKGYCAAESHPEGYHSVGTSTNAPSFHSVFAEKLCEIAEKNENTVAVTAAMGIGTGLDKFGEKYPQRYFDVGIAEAHALTFSAGLAAAGLSPYVAIYSTFLQRGYDSLLHDIALQNLPVKLLIDRAGLALGDGATHHGIFDVSMISHIPNMTLLNPISYKSLEEMLDYASACDGPIAIRYPNAAENARLVSSLRYLSEDVRCRVLCDFPEDEIPELIYVTYGRIYERVISARMRLSEDGKKAGVIVLETLKPYDRVARLVYDYVNSKRVLFVEEGIKNGGAGEILHEELMKLGLSSITEYRIAAIDDNFASPGYPVDLYEYTGLSENDLVLKMKEEKAFDI